MGVLALVLMSVTLFSGRATAVLDPNTFELDGNTLVNNAPAHDWSQVFDSATYGAHGADKALFLPDYFPGADDQPATGATKDVYDMDQWDCKAAGLSPPKNDMANAFVAIYTVSGRQLIYFGLDRINSDNGDANVGFWFLKQEHTCDLATGEWNNQKHSVGDTLVTSAFSGGGRVSTINVFEWCSNPAAPDLKCGSSTSIVQPQPGKGNGPLQLVFTGADCRNEDGTPSTFATGLACATVNRTINTESPPWTYTGAGTPSNTYERGALFEGGIDATGLDLDLTCIGTFVADTRSSTSPTAQLHDFRIGQTDTCSASVATQSSTTSTTVVPGTSVSDTATVTQTPSTAPVPTGTVKFFLCQPSEVTAAGCPAGAGTQIGTPAAGETLNSSGVAVSESTTNTTAIGKYCWRAEYSGDTIYAGSSHTNATTECFTTVKQPSQTATTSSPTGGSVVPGTSVSDSATVTGGVGQPTPTGTVKFFLCQPADVTAGGCEGTAGTQIGTPAAGETLDANGQATSESTTNTTAIGKYCWRAEYSGDGFYLPSSHTNATTECFTTVKQPSQTATTSSPTGGNVVPGTSVSDTATVTGGVGQPTPTGTVKFFLCQPADVTAGGCEGTAGTQIGTPAAGETLDANGQATSESTTNTTAIGTYCWRAEYSGDGFYLPSSHTNATTECFTTVKQPSQTSTTSNPTGGDVVPGTSVTDSATVTGGAGQPTPTGTVKFFLCQPNEVTAGGCETGGTQIGTPAEGETLDANGQATSESTSNTTAIGTYCWRAEYSGDGFYLPSSHTNATTECFTTVKQPSTTVTSASPSGPILAGQSVSDSATVTGGAGQPTPTGTVKFFLCQPNEVTAGGCETGGTQIGTPAEGETLDANGQATSESTGNTTTVGKYCWRAEYSGDDFYLPSSHTNALTEAAGGVTPECFTTFNPTTVISIADQIVGLPADATGTVTYGIFTDSECTTAVTTGTPASGDITPSPNTVTGGVAPMSNLYTPATPGTYYIKATFTGTGTYAGVNFVSCTENAVLTF